MAIPGSFASASIRSGDTTVTMSASPRSTISRCVEASGTILKIMRFTCGPDQPPQ